MREDKHRGGRTSTEEGGWAQRKEDGHIEGGGAQKREDKHIEGRMSAEDGV